MRRTLLFSVSVLFAIAPALAQEISPTVVSASSASHYNSRGYDLYVLGKHEQAIEMYRKSLEFDWDKQATVYNNLGAAYYALKDYDDAAQCYQKAVDLDADYTKAKVNLAAAHFRLRHYWKAARILRVTQKKDPTYVQRRLKPEKVRQELHAENQRNPGNPFLLQLVSLADDHAATPVSSLTQDAEIQEIVSSVNGHFAQLETFSARVVRNTKSSRGSARQEWKVLLRPPDQIRVEWLGSQPMTFVSSGTEAWYYTPAEKKAVHVRQVDSQTMPRMDLGLNVLPEYIQTHRFTLAKEAPKGQWLLIGRPSAPADRIAEIRLWIDQATKCLLRSELYDREGQLRVKTTYSRFRELEQGLQLPGKCTILSYDQGSTLESEMTFLELRVNVRIQDADFRFDPPQGVEVVEE